MTFKPKFHDVDLVTRCHRRLGVWIIMWRFKQ